MITFLCAAVCQGCRAPVNVWRHGEQIVIRDRSMVESPVHLCSDPERRERIDLDYYADLARKSNKPIKSDIREMLAHCCPRCGDQDVALTSWGRLVDFPSDPQAEGWAEAWVGPLTEHVCQQNGTIAAQQAARPVWEAYGH